MVRRHMDEWISSGYKSDIEMPRDRTVGRDLLAELNFLDREDRPFSVTVLPDGVVAGRFSQRHMLLPPESLDEPTAHKILEAEQAAYTMLLFLDYGGLKHHIAKCTHPDCAEPYFIRARLHAYYKRPALCPHHRKQAAGTRARKDEHDELLALAAKFWPQWTERKHPNRALWIAERVNERRKGTQRHITQKWVSRNIDCRTGKIKASKKRSKENEHLQAR